MISRLKTASRLSLFAEKLKTFTTKNAKEAKSALSVETITLPELSHMLHNDAIYQVKEDFEDTEWRLSFMLKEPADNRIISYLLENCKEYGFLDNIIDMVIDSMSNPYDLPIIEPVKPFEPIVFMTIDIVGLDLIQFYDADTGSIGQTKDEQKTMYARKQVGLTDTAQLVFAISTHNNPLMSYATFAHYVINHSFSMLAAYPHLFDKHALETCSIGELYEKYLGSRLLDDENLQLTLSIHDLCNQVKVNLGLYSVEAIGNIAYHHSCNINKRVALEDFISALKPYPTVHTRDGFNISASFVDTLEPLLKE